ncbi:DUF885 domain-containing protein [Flavobacterium degerlachei]|jgi:uncharacterized protein (DUF885 family)|uniref:Uncharacterized conserved protein, DUF885 familyt n=1 Tax=Flavobacterium degerlachei TaxID=229203 RepID=A0A1H2YD60_9FLAO|nr:DUF885 domain-containing protein [Flavobacterium degerlachei]SDX03000.1 Uncharacterized conserved protein, DUF885 familyt [Flavobacterium degerlachei]
MKKTPVVLIAILVSILVVNCKSKEQDFTSITKSYFDDKNALDPLSATQNGQNEYNDQLQFEMTDSFRKAQLDFFKKYETTLSSIDESQLSEEEKNSYEIIKWEVEVGKELLKQPTNLMPIHQFWGTHLTMGQYAGGTSGQPFKTEKDYTNFLKRMDTYSVWIDSAMVYMKKGIENGAVLPKSLTEKVIPQFAEMATPNIEDNLFYSSIKLMPATFSDQVKKDITAKYTATINDKLIPQYKKMSDFLKNEYLPASRKTSGIGNLAFGKELYAAYVKQWTTTEMTPSEIHDLGLKEVARINSEMEKVKTQVGFKGTLMEFFDYVRNKPELKPFKKPEDVIANFERIHSIIKPNVDKLFSLQPKTKFEIRRTEAFREKTASAEYSQGTADGSRPGVFYVPIPDVKEYNMYGDEDLFLHEAIPGHHFQISLQQENTSLPDFRKYNWFGAYGEGWALYTESLGKELGLYKDPYQYFGMLGNEMHRAVRLVVDTGLHSKGWTREQAIKYSLENEAESEASITTEIERYMAIPGQALSYKIGQLKIMELRKRAQDKMGDKFDIKKFHEIVLESGVMPLALLEKKIDVWIAEK